MLTPSDLFAVLDRLGIRHETVTHPPMFTVAEGAALHAELPGGHTKNLFLKDAKGRLFLVTARAHAAIDLKTLHRRIDAARFSFGNAALLKEILGVEPGSVSPFAVLADRARRVDVVLDADLMAEGIVRAHPFVNAMTTTITADDLRRFLEWSGHPPRILRLAGPA